MEDDYLNFNSVQDYLEYEFENKIEFTKKQVEQLAQASRESWRKS